MMDKVKHFILCFVVTLFLGWKIGVTVSVTKELTQAEAKSGPWKKPFWKQLFRKDTAFDLIADGLGIGMALFVRSLIFKHWVII